MIHSISGFKQVFKKGIDCIHSIVRNEDCPYLFSIFSMSVCTDTVMRSVTQGWVYGAGK